MSTEADLELLDAGRGSESGSRGEEICRTCGTPLVHRANYCHFCGKRLASCGRATATAPAREMRGNRKGAGKFQGPALSQKREIPAGFGVSRTGLTLVAAVLVLAAAGAGAWRWMQSGVQADARNRVEQLEQELAAATERDRALQVKHMETLRAMEAEREQRQAAEDRAAGLVQNDAGSQEKLVEMERKFAIETRLRQGAKGYLEAGDFSFRRGSEPDPNVVRDPEDATNDVFRLINEVTLSRDLLIPDDVESVRVIFRARVTEGQKRSDATASGDPEPGTLVIRFLGKDSEVLEREVQLLPSPEWLNVELFFDDLGEVRRGLSMEVDGFPAEVYIDNITVIDAYPIPLDAGIYKHYNTPEEKIYYYFVSRLQAMHKGMVKVDLPQFESKRVTLPFTLAGERYYYRFEQLRADKDYVDVKAGAIGEKAEIYRLRQGVNGSWSIVEIRDAG